MPIEKHKRELIIAASAFGFGFFILPLAIYWVGQEIIGEYSPDAGVWDLAENVWADLLNLEPAAWILVLCPYLLVQLARLVRRLWRRAKAV